MMVADDSASFSASRRTAYAFSSDGGTNWTTFNNLRVPDRRSGFPSLDIGRGQYVCDPIIVNHNSIGTVLQSIMFVDDPPGAGAFTEIAPPAPLGTDEPGFPEVAGAADGSATLVASRFAAGSAHRARTDFVSWQPWQDVTTDFVSDGYVAEADSGGNVGIVIGAPESPLQWLESTDNGITWPAAPTELLPDIIPVGGDQFVIQQGLDLMYHGGDTLITFGVTKLSQGIPTASHQGIGFWSRATGFVLAVPHDSIPGVIDTLVKRQVNQNPAGYPALGLSGSTIVIAFQAFMAETSGTGFNYADIFLVYSNDGGATWSRPANITQTSSLDERYVSISKWNSPGEANLVFQEDPQPGAGSFGDGSPLARIRQVFYKRTGIPTDVPDHRRHLPDRLALFQNYPNPFNPGTSITYQISRATSKIPASTLVTLKVYDVLGREVATLVNERKVPGTYTVQFDASTLASGVYLYRLSAGESILTRKMLVVK
jgi:hypothetical protein